MSWTHYPDDLVTSRVDNAFAFLQQYPDEHAYGERPDVVAFSAPAVDGPGRARRPDRADRRCGSAASSRLA